MVERMPGVMRHSKMGVIFFPKTRANWAASRAERQVDKLVSRIRGACDVLPKIEAKISAESTFILKSDSKVAFDRLQAAKDRLAKLRDACSEGGEIPKSEIKKDAAGERHKEFLEAGKSCNRQSGITTRSSPKQQADWVACMQAAGYSNVTKYLNTEEREDFTP